MRVRNELVPFCHHFNNFKAKLTFIALASKIADKPSVGKDVEVKLLKICQAMSNQVARTEGYRNARSSTTL